MCYVMLKMFLLQWYMFALHLLVDDEFAMSISRFDLLLSRVLILAKLFNFLLIFKISMVFKIKVEELT